MDSSNQFNRRRRRSYFKSSMNSSNGFNETPSKPDEVALESWVEKLRNGDLTHRDDIIKSHIRLGMAIAAEFSTPARVDDLTGEALLAVTQAVEWSGPHVDADGEQQPSRLHDNNITPYIVSTVRRFLRDFIETDRAVYMPGRTLRKKVADGEVDSEGKTNDPLVLAVLSETYSQDNIMREKVRGERGFNVPTARRDVPTPEFREALDLATRNDEEREIIDYRSKGFRYTEIAEAMKLSKTHVGRVNAAVEARFNLLYA